jgi:hypothetical protein
MNKLILGIIALCFGVNLVAQNNLTIFSEDGQQFYLILNGIRQNVNPETNVKVNGLMADYYTSKIIFVDEALIEIEKKMLMVTGVDCKPCDVTYKIKADKQGVLAMKPFSFTDMLMALPPPPNVTVVQYNTAPLPPPILGVHIIETTTTTNYGNSDNVNIGMSVGGFNMGVNVNVNDGFGSSQSTTTTTTSTTMMTGSPAVLVPEVGCPVMIATSYNSLISSIDKKSFGDDKLTLAKQAISSNCMSVVQIKGVMNVLGWEDNRLDFAKHAYSRCVDPQNYFQVNDAFDFDSSTEELDEYIR